MLSSLEEVVELLATRQLLTPAHLASMFRVLGQHLNKAVERKLARGLAAERRRRGDENAEDDEIDDVSLLVLPVPHIGMPLFSHARRYHALPLIQF